MSILLKNALLLDLDPLALQPGELVIDEGLIQSVGPVAPGTADEVIDCEGALVMPGMVNGHTHLYSALAVGMPPPANPPQDFLQILQSVWWKLDQALDEPLIELSARIGAIQAVRCGTTTLIDHHASPNCIDGSLDLVERGLAAVGLRGVLCYETTDRHGPAGRESGLRENRRYLEKCRSRASDRFAGMVGGHACFTLEDESLDRLARLASQFDTGVHLHVAEDPCDDRICRERFGCGLIDRLERHGLISPRNLLAHCIHLDDEGIERLNASGVSIAHNPRSNMNNAVGYARLSSMCAPVQLGTDGIGGDLFAEAQHAWFKARDARARQSPNDVLAMLSASARKASSLLGVTLGTFRPGAAADIVITDYKPFTPASSQNIAGHLLFGVGSRHVKDVLVGGRCVLRDRAIAHPGALPPHVQVQEAARRLWRAVAAII